MSFVRLSRTVLILLPVLASCGGSQLQSSEDAEIPDTVSVNFRQVSVSSEGRVEVQAARVEAYDSSDRTIFYEAGIRETRPDGEQSLDGGADMIELEGSGDGRASGNIRIEDHTEDLKLEAEELEWDSDNRRLVGNGTVTVTSGSGLTVSGNGFVADTARESYTFSDGVEGTLEVDDEG